MEVRPPGVRKGVPPMVQGGLLLGRFEPPLLSKNSTFSNQSRFK